MIMWKLFDDCPIPDSLLGERQIRVIATTDTPDRAGDIVVPQGVVLKHFQKNPIVLWQHDPRCPIGKARLIVLRHSIEAVITFAAKGVSADADKVCALAKAGVVQGVSIGFRGIQSEPIAGGGWRYTKWELLEISLVSIGCNPEALVLGKADQRLRPKAGRVLSGANTSALTGLLGHLQTSEDLHDEGAKMLDQADKHRRKARRLGNSILNNASPDAEPDDDDADPDDATGADVELAARAHRRRLREISQLASSPADKASAARLREIDILRFGAPV